MLLKLALDRDPIGVVAQSRNGKHHCHLEGSKARNSMVGWVRAAFPVGTHHFYGRVQEIG